MALMAGADLVIEIPTAFCTGPAESFAFSAISLLNALGVCDAVVFGAENTDLKSMKRVADVLLREPKQVSEDIKTWQKNGCTYPKAVSKALSNYFGEDYESFSDLVEKPNNILGIEYLKALKRLRSSMEPIAIQRWHTDYHDEMIYSDTASATALRKILEAGDEIEKITPYVPAFVAREFEMLYGERTPVTCDDFSQVLQYKLVSEAENLDDYLDITSDMKERVKDLLPQVATFSEWATTLNNKSVTLARIQRSLLHVLLNIKKDTLQKYESDDYCLYARILGFRKASKELLSQIKKNSSLPLVTKMADAKQKLPEKAYELLKTDIFAADLYRNVVYQKFKTPLKDEYTHGIIML